MEQSQPNSVFWMKKAVSLAQAAEKFGDRPFGAIVVNSKGKAIGQGIGTGLGNDPTRHSEITAIRHASKLVGGLLDDCTLFSTHEPCTMCTGACLHAHLKCVVFGSFRTDLPQLFRGYTFPVHERFRDSSHPPLVVGGVCRDECIHLFDAEISEIANRRAGY